MTAAMTVIIGALSYGELACDDAQGWRPVFLFARGAGAALGISLRVDALAGNSAGTIAAVSSRFVREVRWEFSFR